MIHSGGFRARVDLRGPVGLGDAMRGSPPVSGDGTADCEYGSCPSMGVVGTISSLVSVWFGGTCRSSTSGRLGSGYSPERIS